jgi:putative OmpL-like beta-barrel porin-2
VRILQCSQLVLVLNIAIAWAWPAASAYGQSAAVAPISASPAEDAPPPLRQPEWIISTLLDSYLMVGGSGPTGRSYYGQRNSPALALAELNMQRLARPNGFGVTTTLIAGDIADINHGRLDIGYEGEAALKNVQQLYVTYLTGRGVTIDVGKFYTLFGYEVPEAINNSNYTRSFPYQLIPRYHGGIRATFPSSRVKGLSLSVAGVNSLYNTREEGVDDDNGTRDLMLRGAYTSPNGRYHVATNYGVGIDELPNRRLVSEQVHLWDNTFTYTASQRVTLGMEYLYRRDIERRNGYNLTGHGYALYYRHQLTPKTAGALRFSSVIGHTDRQPAARDTGFRLNEVTSTYEIKFTPRLTTRLELRYDTVRNPGLVNFATHVRRMSKNSRGTVSIGMLYAF